jgi:hypothetical protein
MGSVPVHTPSTGANYAHLDQYDASIFIGTVVPNVKSYDVGALSTHLASEGFLAIIGWDILGTCIFRCDGPQKSFSLAY